MTNNDPACSSATASINGNQAADTIRYMDYAAWAMLWVILKKAGIAIHPDPVNLTLPHDINDDRIADHWQRAEIRRWNQQYRLNPLVQSASSSHTSVGCASSSRSKSRSCSPMPIQAAGSPHHQIPPRRKEGLTWFDFAFQSDDPLWASGRAAAQVLLRLGRSGSGVRRR